MHKFFEFFIEGLLWLWLPLYTLYKLISNWIEEEEETQEKIFGDDFS